jgi:hypothetical protein
MKTEAGTKFEFNKYKRKIRKRIKEGRRSKGAEGNRLQRRASAHLTLPTLHPPRLAPIVWTTLRTRDQQKEDN